MKVNRHSNEWIIFIFLCNCVDVNECDDSPCGEYATCTNSDGSYHCSCNDGFSGDGEQCSGRTLISLKISMILFDSLFTVPPYLSLFIHFDTH